MYSHFRDTTLGKDEACRGGPDPLAAGRTPVNPQMVGDGMAGSTPAVIRETRRGQAVFMAATPAQAGATRDPLVVGGTLGLDRTHVDAAHLG